MAKFDPLVALRRQQRLAAAARAAVDGRLPELTAVDVGLPKIASAQNEPNSFAPVPAGNSGASWGGIARSIESRVRGAPSSAAFRSRG